MDDKSFKFTEEQKNDLLQAWAGISRKEKAKKYIELAEIDIRRQILFDDMAHRYPGESAILQREELKKYKKAVDNLISCYHTLSFTPFLTSNFNFLGELALINPNLGKALEKAISVQAKHNENLKVTRPIHHDQEFDFINLFLVNMSSSAQIALDEIVIVPRPETRSLVRRLATTYEQYFGKQASYGVDTNFRKFLTNLAPMLDKQIGEDLIEKVLKNL